MTSGDLNIDLNQNSFFTKLVGPLINYKTPFAVCRYDSWFSRSDGRGAEKSLRPIPSLSEPARNMVNSHNVTRARQGVTPLHYAVPESQNKKKDERFHQLSKNEETEKI